MLCTLTVSVKVSVTAMRAAMSLSDGDIVDLSDALNTLTLTSLKLTQCHVCELVHSVLSY